MWTCTTLFISGPLSLLPKIGLRGGEWKRMLLEERYHEAPDVSYADVTANDFDVVLDDAVIKSFLDQTELVTPFDVKDFSVVKACMHSGYRYTFCICVCMHCSLTYYFFLISYPFNFPSFQIFSQLTHLKTQDWREQHLLTSLNLTTSKLEVSTMYSGVHVHVYTLAQFCVASRG